MPWNPEVYNKFKQERYAPFFDALRLVDVRPGIQVVDLGCGTGELTRMLADHLPGSQVLGIDSSAEMLEQSAGFTTGSLRFEHRDILSQLDHPERYDLIFSNAALQWLPDHRALFPDLLDKLKPEGQLVVQMPAQHRNLANVVLYRLASEAPFREALSGHERGLSMLDPEDYAGLLFRAGGREIQVLEKIYPLIVPDVQGVYDFINGSALRPYLNALEGEMKAQFAALFLARLRETFPQQPVFYPFKRILFSTRF